MQHEQEKLHSLSVLWFDPLPLTLSSTRTPTSALALAALLRCCETGGMAKGCRSDERFWENTREKEGTSETAVGCPSKTEAPRGEECDIQL